MCSGVVARLNSYSRGIMRNTTSRTRLFGGAVGRTLMERGPQASGRYSSDMSEARGGRDAIGVGALVVSTLAVVLLVAAGPGTRLGLWSFRFGFQLLRYAV